MQKGQASEPASKTTRLLNENQISELTMNSNSDESLCNVAAMEDKEYCAEVLLETHL
jgi:phosphosulfolactate phosphohydrolase-like enzyme